MFLVTFTSDSKIVEGNKRIWNGIDKDVDGKGWKAINQLGILGEGENEVFMEGIMGMKVRDKEGKKVGEAEIKKIQ